MPQRESAREHEQARTAHAVETAEDYVQAIAETSAAQGACRVMDLTQRFGVTHVTVIKILGRLQREGLVGMPPRGPIELTAPGRRLAARCRQRHETVLRFLRAIGVSARVAERDAHGLEHHVSAETLRRFQDVVRARGG
jgi:DtxR family transcriptional regulator, manganese transport regulator